MKKSIALASRDLYSLFVQPWAYLMLSSYALLAGYFFFTWLGSFNSVLNQYLRLPGGAGRSALALNNVNLNGMVVEPYLHLVLLLNLFFIPALCVRAFSEERRRGTFELLVTAPVKTSELVWGKFLAAGIFITLLIAIASLFPALLCVYGEPGPEGFPILIGILGVLFCSLGFVAVSFAASAMTKGSVTGGVSSMLVLLILYAIHSPAEFVDGGIAQFLTYISPVMRVDELIRGVVSISGLTVLLSMLLLGLFIANRLVDAEAARV